MNLYRPVGSYGGSFPIKRVEGSKFIVIGEVWNIKHQYVFNSFWRQFNPYWIKLRKTYAKEELAWLNIHYDGDDLNHTFLGPEHWQGWPNARKLSEWYNALHKRNMMLRLQTMTVYSADISLAHDRQEIAECALELTKLIKRHPDDEHRVGVLDWSPTGQVWLDGKRWVKVLPEQLK